MPIFINRNESFIKFSEEIGNKSVNEICFDLGYHPDKTHPLYLEKNDTNQVDVIILEVFTTNVIAILANEISNERLHSEVEFFMKDFDFDFEYRSHSSQDILLSAVESQSFDLEFASKVLEFDASGKNEEYYSSKIDAKLFFINGFLASFKYGNELNKWARHIKLINPDIISSYAREANHYFKNDYDKIFDEINLQADSYASTPNAFKNKYIKHHITKFKNVDFIMLLVCHYEQSINLEQFKLINHGRYKYIGISKGKAKYKKGKFKYEFDENGNLIKATKQFF